jgi:phosphoribosylglycinamide formyltransferase-1
VIEPDQQHDGSSGEASAAADEPLPAPIAVFVSGTGRTLRNLFERIDAGDLPASVRVVAASKPCPALEIARSRGVPTLDGAVYDTPERVECALAPFGVRWIVLAGYVKLLPIPPGFAGRVVNIHPALLPKFGGPGMFGMRVHRAVLDAGERRSGCTVHLADGAYDSGPVLAQASCEVQPTDTPEDLAARVFALELELYPRVLRDVFTGRHDAARTPTECDRREAAR